MTFDATHPFHLHGYSFRVVAMERIGSNVTVDQIRSMDENGLIRRNLVDAPIKDTVAIPDGGYTAIRFLATNPGISLNDSSFPVCSNLCKVDICFLLFRLLVAPLSSGVPR